VRLPPCSGRAYVAKAIAGTPTSVSVLVSVATIERLMIHQGMLRAPMK
jgi:hypothetical protein